MRLEQRLARIHALPLNYEAGSVPGRRWHVDMLCQALPGEPPGEPVPHGPWHVARRLVEQYRMADPALVRATWDPHAPLEGRDMLLELRLYRVLRVHGGVRITRAWDEHRDHDGRPAHVFGYEYATLRGHIEMGRMDYEVWKWADDGAVDFRLHAVSRASGQGAPWTRLGFRIFGRREQVRFYLRCCERIARLTACELDLPGDPPPPAIRLTEEDPARTGEPASDPLPGG
jgi:uncharacterized protein (UPF0548 family)